MGVLIIIYMFICLVGGIISIIQIHKMINILEEEGIPVYFFEFSFSFNKFRKFIETCDDDKKINYTKLYKNSLRLKWGLILFALCFCYIMFIVGVGC